MHNNTIDRPMYMQTTAESRIQDKRGKVLVLIVS